VTVILAALSKIEGHFEMPVIDLLLDEVRGKSGDPDLRAAIRIRSGSRSP
jgi:hypothetical protein